VDRGWGSGFVSEPPAKGSQLDCDAKACEVASWCNEILENTIVKALIETST